MMAKSSKNNIRNQKDLALTPFDQFLSKKEGNEAISDEFYGSEYDEEVSLSQ